MIAEKLRPISWVTILYKINAAVLVDEDYRKLDL